MYKISEKNVRGLFDAIAAEDNELVAAYIKDIYVEIFDNTQALDGDELDTFTAQVDVSSDEGVEGINAELDKLYDFCDAHGISLSDAEPKDVEGELKESANDGWDDSLEGAAILYDLEKLIYEIKKGRKGIYTKAHTYAELADYVSSLADRLSDFAENINEYEEDEDIDEGLVERELSTKERSISKIFVDNKDKINKAGTKEELVSIVKDLLKDVNPERTGKIFATLNSKKDYFRALQYIYDFILKGDDLGVIKEETIDLPNADKMVKDAEKEADKILANLKLEEDCFDCCEDDFGYADDDTKELFSDEDEGEFDDELGFVPDDVVSIDMVADDDGVRETIKPQEVTRVNECTPPQFKPAKPLNMECVDKTPRRIDDIDITMDDDFEPDDVDDIVIGD